jgi:serine/threonine-protein kinase
MTEHRSGRGAESQARGASGAERASRSQAPDPLIGRTINGRFRITGVIARGGMGKVYTAEQAPLGRICAVKILAPRYDGDHDPEFHRRFFLEASTAAKINHPNTVTIFDYGQADDADLYFIAMEYIEGRTLFRALREDGPFDEARAAHVARQICRGVREAHKIGVVHRDLKPGNVLLSDNADEHDLVKVLDFGLVKVVAGATAGDLTEQGLFMGSPKYMAPEQILGHDVSARTDIYSLGVMLYEMLCGKVPFDRGSNMHTLMAHVNEPLPPMGGVLPGLAISPAMEAIVERCLAKDPVARYASTDELLVALKQIGDGAAHSVTYEALPRASLPMEVPTRPGPDPVLFPGPRDLADPGTTRPSPGAPPPAATPVATVPVQAASSWPPAPSAPPPAASPHPSTPPREGGPDTLRTGGVPTNGPVVLSPAAGDSLGAAQRTTIEDDVAAFRGKRRGLAPLLVAAAAVAIGTAALVVAQSGSSTQPVAEPTATPSAMAPPASASPSGSELATAPPGAASASATPRGPRVVHVESEPPGALVTESGKPVCGPTPCDAKVEGDAPRLWSVDKAGWKGQRVTVGATDDRITTRLEAAAAGGKKPLGDYKPSPY